MTCNAMAAIGWGAAGALIGWFILYPLIFPTRGERKGEE